MAQIMIESGPEKGRKAGVRPDHDVTVGRSKESVLRVSDRGCEAKHLRFYIEEGVVHVEALAPAQLSGQPLEGVSKLEGSAQLQIGETTISLRIKPQKKDKLIGRTIGGYELVDKIGRGGMGTVYKARQLNLDRIVALKILSREWNDPNFVEKFKAEARAAGALNHPNIIQVYDVGDEEVKNGILNFFSMEYAAGGSVQELLDAKGRLELSDALGIMLDAATGLEYAEKKAIVHRDIKPENLMVTEAGVTKIVDLGLAQRTDEDGSGDKDSKIFGTPHYVAPEQVKGEKVDHRADLYALGATYFHMLAGRTPFTGNNVKEIIVKQVREEPPALHEVEPSVPEPIAKVVLKMLQKDPDARYQTFGELIEALRNAADESAAAGGLQLTGRSKRFGAGAPAKGQSPVIGAVVTIVVALIGIVVLGSLMSNKKGDGDSSGTVSISSTGISPEDLKKQQDASNALLRIERTMRGETPRKVAALEAHAKQWAGTPAAKESAELATKIKKKLDAEVIKRATAALQAILENMDSAGEESDPAVLADWKRRLEAWKLNNTRNEALIPELFAKAKARLEALAKRIGAMADKLGAFEKALAAYRAGRSGMNYGEALTALKELKGKFPGLLEAARTCDQEIRSEERAAREAVRAALDAADAAAKEHRYEDAIAEVSKVKGTIGIAELETQLDDKIAALKNAAKTHAERQAVARTDQDCLNFELLLNRLEQPKVLGPPAVEKERFALRRYYNIAEAVALIERAKNDFKTETYQKRHRLLLDVAKGAAELLKIRGKGSSKDAQEESWGRAQSFTADDELIARESKLARFEAKGKLTRVYRYANRAWAFWFVAKVKGMTASSGTAIQLSMLPYDMVFDALIRKRRRVDLEAQVAGVAFAILFGHYSKARALAAELEGIKDRELKDELDGYKRALAEVELQFQAEFDRAVRAYEAKDYADAKRSGERMQRRYFDTKRYATLK